MYKIGTYPDSSSYVSTNNQNTETFRINTYVDLWQLGQLVDAKNSKHIRPTIIIPNLLDAQADRRFAKNESYGLKQVIQFLAGLNADFRIFHPHNPEAVELAFEVLGKKVELIPNTHFINKVLKEVNTDNLILMSADAGGYKPLMKLCDDIGWKGETSSCSKARTWDGEKSSLSLVSPTDDFEGKDVMIIDDISVRGGTFKSLATNLNNANVGKLYLAVSHITLERLGDDPVTDYFDKVFTTNSKFENYFEDYRDGGRQPRNLRIFKMFKTDAR